MSPKTVKILLVEDDKSYADQFENIVRSIDQISFEIIWVTRARAAIEKLENYAYHVVMLGLGLPDANSLEALDLLRSVGSNTPIVILTSHDDTDLATQALARGAQDFLVKNEITPQLLVRSIRYSADRQNLEQKAEANSKSSEASVDHLEVQIESSLRMILGHAQKLTRTIGDDETRQMAVVIERESNNILYTLGHEKKND